MRLSGDLARGCGFGDLAFVAIEDRQREIDIERPFRDAVIPVVARLEIELGILPRDRALELGFGLRVLVDRDREIGAREQRRFARRLPIRPCANGGGAPQSGHTIATPSRAASGTPSAAAMAASAVTESARACASCCSMSMRVACAALRSVGASSPASTRFCCNATSRSCALGEPRQRVEPAPRAFAIGLTQRSARGARSTCAP